MPTKTQLAGLKREAASLVREGFLSRNTIVSLLRGWGESYGHPDLRTVRMAVADAILTHHRRQARWTRPTDCDRLDAAFEEMTRHGLIAEQYFTDCASEGHFQLLDEVKKADPKEVIGYAFYHEQATEHAIKSGWLYIHFDAREKHRGKKRRVGWIVFEAVTAAGLRAVWDGDPGRAVEVELTWRKRRTDKLPKGK